ncbi:peptidoglycan recognition protein family protein [Streptomyces niveiscabiei]|uniref:peptidoglycan recognition protein family protein n=1 Tax=Streptomyces niveiscabiei TaxID=164115 RepID=UPI000A91429F|nr:peptidoglycan recognition family protein [Streptomyces niveiscabiei]
MKLVTRAQLGWPTSAAPIQTSTRGVKIHYEGTSVSTRLLTDHSACLAEWKDIRASHLANKRENYSDVAYNYAACPHGYLLEGRGIGRRTGANGNQELNRNHYAIVGLLGSSGLTKPTDAMLGAIRDGIELLRKNGAGTEIKGHRDGYATDCPGGPLYAWVQKGAPRPATTSTSKEDTDMPTAKEIATAVWAQPIPNRFRKDAAGKPVPTPAGTFLEYGDAHYDVLAAKLDSLTTAVEKLTAALAAKGA